MRSDSQVPTTTVPMIRGLTFSGGGVKGFAYPGALRALDELGHLSHMTRFAGTSIGAFFAALVASGFTVSEIWAIADAFDPTKLKAPRSWLTRIYRLWSRLGMCDATQALEDQLVAAFEPRFPNVRTLTLGEHFAQTQRELVVVACCITRQQTVFFHHAQFPSVRLIDALLCSMAIPEYFEPYSLTCFPDGVQDLFMDGGLADNYPLWVFNDLQHLYAGTLHLADRTWVSHESLGLKPMGPHDTNTDLAFDGRVPVTSAIESAKAIARFAMLQIERSTISPSSCLRTVPIPVGETGALDLDITIEQRADLARSAHQAVHAYFIPRSSPPECRFTGREVVPAYHTP